MACRLNPEARLLAAWARPEPAQEAAADALDTDLDWSRFARYALRHAVAPMAARHLHALRTTDPARHASTPSAVRDGFAALLAANIRRTLRLAGELSALLTAFASHGVEVLTVKGPLLAEAVDGALGLRMTGDLDLLIAPRQAADAKRLLQERGFRLARGVETTHAEDVFLRAEDGLCVELHHRLDYPWLPFGRSTETLLDDRAAVVFQRRPAQTLPPAQSLLYTAYHGAKHGWSRLAWLSAFAAQLEDIELENGGGRIAAEIEARRLDIAFGASLALCRALGLTATEPRRLTPFAEAAPARRLAERTLPQLFLEAGAAGGPDGGALLSAAAQALASNRPEAGYGPQGRRAALRLPPAGGALSHLRLTHALGGHPRRLIRNALFKPKRGAPLRAVRDAFPDRRPHSRIAQLLQVKRGGDQA